MEMSRGTLRVSASVTTGQHLLAPLVAEFIAQNSEVQLELVLVIRIGALSDSCLVARSLGHCGLFLYAGAEYLKARGTLQKPEDLQNHDCLVMSEGRTNNQWTLSTGDITKQVSLSPRASVNDFDTLRRMAADGAGITILPSYLHSGEYEKRLVRVLDDWAAPSVDFHAVFPSHRGATPKVRAFLDFLIVRLTTFN
jgi:DNA-binding transcriptional LysR family regulator